MFPAARPDDFPVDGPVQLRLRPPLMRAVQVGLAAAQEEGAIPKDRADPEGDEWIVWIGPAASPLGFAVFYDVGRNRMWLDVLYVAPVARRCGFATRIVAHVAISSRVLGSRRLLLGTSVGNRPMDALAEKLGLELVSVIRGRDL